MKIVVLDGYTLNPGDLSWKGLEELGELTVHDRLPGDAGKIIDAIGDAEIIFTNKTLLNSEVLEKVPWVKYIGVLATGYNIVDIDAARKLEMIVTNVPSYGTDSVAQMTFALLLELCHHVGAHNDSVKGGQWTGSVDFCYWNSRLIELAGKTMGIIGFGRIGKATAKIAMAFGMNVVVYDTDRTEGFEDEKLKFAGLEQLFNISDVISLHCPLNEGTKGIINARTISLMKDGVIILNTARGPLVVEADLADALESGKVAGAAVDVVSVEPIETDNPLLKAPNCIITPHIAWAPSESRQRLMHTTVENLKAFLNGSPVNVVNR
jgi:glycerate dehydrogenase